MGSCTFTKDTQVHAPGISFFCVCWCGFTHLFKSPELVHNLAQFQMLMSMHVSAVELEMEEGQVRMDRGNVGLMG